jgi:ELWxxDGT repeat protein
MLKDINPGAGSSTPFNFTVFNNALYFIASDGVVNKLWKTDGTEAGTIALTEAGGTYTPYGLTSMAVWDNFLYFPGVDATYGTELWKTDGTVPGTTLVKDINPGAASSDLQYLISVGDKLVFRATTAAAGAEPWVSDGTTGGTVLLQDIEPGSGSSNIERFTIMGNKLFALASNSTVGREVWVANNFVLLPLRFESFAVQRCDAGQACLSWKTSNEQNVSHFDIERSTDGKNFKKIGIKSANNQSQNNYTAVDDISLLHGSKQLYYRIRQFDKDGKSQLSSVQWLRLDNKGVLVYPTVAASTFTVQNNAGSNLDLQLLDVSGRVVLQQKVAMGTNTISVEHLPQGILFYKVLDEGRAVVNTGKILKQ